DAGRTPGHERRSRGYDPVPLLGCRTIHSWTDDRDQRRDDGALGEMMARRLRFMFVLGILVLTAHSSPFAQTGDADVALKTRVIREVEAQSAQLIDLSDQIWRFAETALKEAKSSKLLADYAEQAGFRVTRGVAGLPTALVAEFGQGSPVIGIMGEYDALPGISQKAQPTREALVEGAPGHGCGHNMFGAASLGAATAIKRLIADGSLKGTIKFFGTPAEEDVGGKIYMAREGVFKDVDVMLAWHPATRSRGERALS